MGNAVRGEALAAPVQFAPVAGRPQKTSYSVQARGEARVTLMREQRGLQEVFALLTEVSVRDTDPPTLRMIVPPWMRDDARGLLAGEICKTVAVYLVQDAGCRARLSFKKDEATPAAIFLHKIRPSETALRWCKWAVGHLKSCAKSREIGKPSSKF